jgi:threonine/homoserine/homoserine lactone efflux protein
MTGHLPVEPAVLLAYTLAALALVIAPGPGQALVLTRTVESGTRGGLLTSLGLEIGTLAHTLAAALGLSAILATSATAYAVVKYAGALYLVALGSLMLWRARASGHDRAVAAHAAAASGSRLVLHAAMTGVLNPKVAVFFLAFLPQFVRPERGAVLAQFLVLGLVLSTLGFIFDASLAVIAGRARRRLTGSARFAAWRERVTGAVLMGLGLKLALADRR